jgi:hypothetical protein
MDVVERFATDKRWRIDTLIALLGIAGDQAADAIPCATIVYIGQCEEYQVTALPLVLGQLQFDFCNSQCLVILNEVYILMLQQ